MKLPVYEDAEREAIASRRRERLAARFMAAAIVKDGIPNTALRRARAAIAIEMADAFIQEFDS